MRGTTWRDKNIATPNDAGKGRCEASRGVTDFLEIGRRPHRGGHLRKDRVEEMQPRHEDVAVTKVGECEVAVPGRLGHRHRPCDGHEDQHDDRGEDQIGRTPRPVQRQRSADDKAEGHRREANSTIDRGERGSSVLAVMIADETRHHNGQQGTAESGNRCAGERHWPHWAEAKGGDADRDARGSRQQRSTPTEPIDDRHAEVSDDQRGHSEDRAVERRGDSGEFELMTQLAEHEPDALPTRQQRIAESRRICQPIPPELVGGGRARRHASLLYQESVFSPKALHSRRLPGNTAKTCDARRVRSGIRHPAPRGTILVLAA